ncbi:MAG TPA: site-specific integrase [Lacipirellulaceae bacterium]|nr:site-specific integrase [Lacipirellulaceae bacterium]
MASIRKRQWTTARGEIGVAWIVDFLDPSGARQRVQFLSRREAVAFRTDIEGQLKAGSYRANAAKVTVTAAADLFLADCEARMERGEQMTRHNYKVYEGHIRNYICPNPERHAGHRWPSRLRRFEQGLGTVTLRELSAGRVVEFRDALRTAGVSPVTTRKILETLKLLLDHAIGLDLVASNVARGVRVIRRRDEGVKRITPPAKEAMRQLIDAADPDFRVKLVFASTTGVRAGELHALRWRHLNLDKGEVKIEARVDIYGDEDVTKTAAGMRSVPLGNSVVTVLKAWKLRAKTKKGGDLVFPNTKGGFENHDNMMKRSYLPLFAKLQRLHQEAPSHYPPAPRYFNWHALRHFAISCWIEAGLTPKTVQTFAGHSSLQITMDRYGHLFPSDDHKAAMDAIAAEVSTLSGREVGSSISVAPNSRRQPKTPVRPSSTRKQKATGSSLD